MKFARSGLIRHTVAGFCVLALLTSPTLAQGRNGGGGPPGGGAGGGKGGGIGAPGDIGGPGFRGGSGRPDYPGPGVSTSSPNYGSRGGGPASEGAPRLGLEFGPPGVRWWDDHGYIKSLKLRPDQKSRMDSIFEQNRGVLLSRLQGLQQAETQMEHLAKSSSPDEAALLAQIDRVAQAQADLAKANTHMLLEMRKQLQPDQIKRLENHR